MKLRLPENNNRHVTGKSVYQLYLMLKGHFNGKYDVIKYHWRMKVSDAAYNKRRDRYFFEKLADKYTLKELTLIFISNLVANQNAWIGEISDADALVFYRSYIGKLGRIESVYKEDIENLVYFSKKVDKPLREILEYNKNVQTSYIFKMLQSELINFESFIMLDSFLDLINKHDECANDLVWSNYSTKLNAYKKLLVTDKETARAQFIETVKNCQIK